MASGAEWTSISAGKEWRRENEHLVGCTEKHGARTFTFEERLKRLEEFESNHKHYI